MHPEPVLKTHFSKRRCCFPREPIGLCSGQQTVLLSPCLLRLRPSNPHVPHPSFRQALTDFVSSSPKIKNKKLRERKAKKAIRKNVQSLWWSQHWTEGQRLSCGNILASTATITVAICCKNGKNFANIRLIKHLLLWSGNQSLEAILLQRDTGELKMLYKRRQLPFFLPPDVDTTSMMVI